MYWIFHSGKAKKKPNKNPVPFYLNVIFSLVWSVAPITNLEVFVTLVRVISRVSGIGSGAMTAARLFLTSGSISLPLWGGNSDKQRNTDGGLTTVNGCHVSAEC